MHRFESQAWSAVERIAGRNSAYARHLDGIRSSDPWSPGRVRPTAGVLESLLLDLKRGHLRSLEELVHADVFGDFIDMAKYLMDAGYKDAAAVIVGSTLEAHLRALCTKSGIPTESKGSSRPKKADRLNADLAKAAVYSKADQKAVTAWLDLRNDAAHGKYDSYTKDQVALLTMSVRDFVTRHPA